MTLPAATYRTAFGSEQLRFGLVDVAGDAGAARAAVARSLKTFPGAYVDTPRTGRRPRRRGWTSC